jgi:hypothetical protein
VICTSVSYGDFWVRCKRIRGAAGFGRDAHNGVWPASGVGRTCRGRALRVRAETLESAPLYRVAMFLAVSPMVRILRILKRFDESKSALGVRIRFGITWLRAIQ